MNENQLAVFRRKHLGFIFQSFNLFPSYTALENVVLPLLFAGVPVKERTAKAKEILTTVGLSDRLDHKPSEPSGGQQQRVSIARALILADEPAGNLDSRTGTEVMVDIGKSLLLYTNNLDSRTGTEVMDLLTSMNRKRGKPFFL